MLPMDAKRRCWCDDGKRDLCTNCGHVIEYDRRTDAWFDVAAAASNSPDPWGCSFALVHEAGGV